MARVNNTTSSNRRKHQHKVNRIKQNPASKPSQKVSDPPHSNQFSRDHKSVTILITTLFLLAGLLLLTVPFFVASNGVPGEETYIFNLALFLCGD